MDKSNHQNKYQFFGHDFWGCMDVRGRAFCCAGDRHQKPDWMQKMFTHSFFQSRVVDHDRKGAM